MSRENILTQKQWDDVLTSVQRLCQVYWCPSEELSQQMLQESFLHPFKTVTSLIETHTDNELTALRTLIDGFSEPESIFAYLEEGTCDCLLMSVAGSRILYTHRATKMRRILNSWEKQLYGCRKY